MKQHLMRIVAAAIVVAAVVAGTAVAATGRAQKPDPAKRMASLRHQVSALRKDRDRLRPFSPQAVARQLARTKAALDRYQSVDAATADGYRAESPCEATPTDPEASWWGGAMGIHYVNDALLRGPVVPTKPQILTYAPAADGHLELLAAEYFQADADQNVQTDDDRPSVFGRAFDGPMLGHAPGMPVHYDLHVWLWKHNPSGLFAPWNPNVTCPTP